MRVFLTRQINNNDELRTQLGWVESELAAILMAVANIEKVMRELQEKVQAVKTKARRMGEEKKAAEAK